MFTAIFKVRRDLSDTCGKDVELSRIALDYLYSRRRMELNNCRIDEVKSQFL